MTMRVMSFSESITYRMSLYSRVKIEAGFAFIGFYPFHGLKAPLQ